MPCEEPRPKLAAAVDTADSVNLFGLTQGDSSRRYQGALRICAWCQRIPLRQDFWVEIEKAEQMLPFFSLAMLEEATHGVCPECYRAFLSGNQTAHV